MTAADQASIIRTARIIAGYMTALADALEEPDGIIKFSGDLTEEQLAEIRKRWEDVSGGAS